MNKNLRNTVKNYIFTAMKITELRLGNHVKFKEYIFSVIEIGTERGAMISIDIVKQVTINDKLNIHIEAVRPIPITEDILLQLGFKSVGLSGFVFQKKVSSGNYFTIESDCGLWYPHFNNQLCSIAEFKYIHQLQNLYYAITGSELRLKRELHPFNQTEKNIQP